MSNDILSQLRADTDQSLNRLEAETGLQSMETKIAALEQQMEEAAQIKDEDERQLRMKVLQADFEEMRSELRKEEEDLSQAVFGLNAIMNEMGSEYEDLMQLSDDEKAVIQKAKDAVAAAEAEIAEVKATPGWKFAITFSSRETKLAEAEKALEIARKGVETADIQAKKMARDRLMKASFEESLQQFMYKVDKTIKIMEDRRTEIQKQLEQVAHRKAESFRIKEEAAKILEDLDQKLNEEEAKLKNRENELDTLVNGSAEYVSVEQAISSLRAEVEGLRGRRNQALVLFQSKERFAAELDVHEKSQMKLRDNQDAWITLLRSDTEERLTTFRSRLEAMKAMSDQEAAEKLDTLGTSLDKSNVDFMAQVGSASDRRRMKMVESQPERIKRIEEARAAQAEAQAQIREREKSALEEFRKRYGLDPLDSSFFSYSDKETESN
ncbi:hypothetical protein [Rubellicoccus peritrichatus]|uniref:Uncharacterized protein n=1 Tax=Rubellicoccus peritrichatus TaxID=3080537 RepID=A0AAQ3QRV8_9BACT|nr:hypothetical protein [Puniceicoccus sp. CR14]WOO41693.1 hypothetical protein RZN69_01235 [Puniceicoccus sp. CR14]